MAVNILLKKSSTPDNRPNPADMLNGEVDINFDAVTGGLFYKNTNGDVVKVGPCQFSPTPPNATPAGSPGNSVGELWFNTAVNGLFIWDGTSWIDVTTGIAVQTISGLSPIVIDNTDPTDPVVTLPSTAPGDLLVGDPSGSFGILAAGAAEYILQSNGDGTLSWVVNSAGDVTSVTAVAPIVVDNTDPQNPVVSADAATTSAPGVVQLNDTVTSTSTTEAATANAVKTAYDAALNAVQTVTSTTPITVDNTDPQNPIVGIDAASTGQAGAVQLNDTVTSTSTTEAATANAVKTAYDAAVNSVQTVTGTAPVQVDNTDPQNLDVSVDAATTTTPGIVQLNDTTSSSSTSEALTANQGYILQQQIDALVVTNNLTFAGTYNASTGLVDNVSAAGASVGFVAGSPLPAAAPGNADYFVIVDVEGSTGPAGTPPYHVGDWFLSDGAAYQFLNVGFQPAYATTSSSGVVQLATDLEVQAGLNTDYAVVPSSLQSKLSDSTSTTSSTTIASSTAVKSAYDLGAAAIPCSSFTAGGDLLVATGAGTYVALPIGTNGQSLVVDTTCLLTGCLKWGQSLVGYTCTASPFNTALGACAGDSIAGGSNNTMVGHNAGTAISVGVANTLIGMNAGDSITTGGVNTAVGFNALHAATTGGCNVAIGAGALSSSTTACCNIAIGYQTLESNSSGVRNTAVGTHAGRLITTGSDNTIVGFAAGDTATGTNNTLIGSNAGSALTLGGTNILIGANAGDTITTGFNNTIIGDVNGSAALTDNLILAAGTTVKFQANNSGAWSPNGINYGTAGQVLTSAGSGAAVTWASLPTASTSAAGIVQLNDTTSSTSTTEAATANAVKAAYDAAVTATNWTDTAGVLTPAVPGNVVSIPVAAGVDGLKVEDTALNFSTVVRPDLIQMTDNVQSLSFNPATSVITHVVDSLLSNTAGVVAQDESANLTPYNIAASYLSLNGVATGINIRTLPWPQIESWDSMNINIANFSGALGMQAGGVDLVLVGGDNGGGVSYLQAQPNVMIEGFGPLNIKPATDAVDAVQFQTSAGSKVLTVDTLTPAVKIGDGVSAYTLPIADGAANYILSTDGAGTVSWIANAADGVQSVSGTSPVTVDNTDPANPIISVDAASTSAAGIVQLNDTTSSTSTSEAATANAVKIAYDTAVAAASGGTVNGITSDTVIFVNCTDGNNSTGQRGTNKPFLTITAALAAASEGDTIFLSPGTFIENVTLSKGVNLVGTMNDQALAAGTKIQGNFTVSISGAPTKNWAISHVYFISTNSTPPFTVSNNSFGAGGIATVNNCTFTQQTSADPTQYAVATSGTWSRSLYFRECTFDGSFHHNAGTAAGASGYVVLDRVLGVGNSDFYYRVTTGTLEIRNPSNSLASVFQTGGVALIQNAASGITANGAATTTVFGGTGFSYKGSAASAGTGTVYFTGETQGTGKVEFGANLIYGYTSLIMDPANLTVNVAAIAYTTAVPSAANAQTISQQRPRLDLLKTSSSVTAANQLGTVVDLSTGAIYSVTAFDAGTY